MIPRWPDHQTIAARSESAPPEAVGRGVALEVDASPDDLRAALSNLLESIRYGFLRAGDKLRDELAPPQTFSLDPPADRGDHRVGATCGSGQGVQFLFALGA